MYTLENLQQKNLKELKKIGWELNVLPEGDRRLRRNWIKALANVQPPLLQLLEVSPGAEIEPVQEAIEIQRQEPIESSPEALECPSCGAVHALYATKDYLDRSEIRCLHCNYSRFKNYPGPILLEAQEPPIYRPETKDGIDLQDFTVQAQEPPIESKFGRIVVYPKPAVKLIAQNAETRPQLDRTESADVHNWRSHPAESARDSSSAKVEALGSKEGDRVLAVAGNSEAARGGILPCQPIELATKFNDEQPPNRGDGKGRIEPKLSQSAIVPAAKNLPRSESDLNPILTGVTFSDNFLARYSPPQPENIHYQADADGQLSLLNFEVESVDEPPDPDDFESLDAFREAIALWDAENAEAFTVSMDSMCEWAPCPHEWYEPEPENLPLKASSMREPSEVMEHSPAPKSSSTCNFSIPTFDAWCDRTNRQNDSDEPPDTGNFARLPGPKPPKFPPRAIGQSHTKRKSNAYQTQVNHISITSQSHLNHIVAAGSSSRSGRAPPGGCHVTNQLFALYKRSIFLLNQNCDRLRRR